MNKRNFGRVIKRIEQEKDIFNQGTYPWRDLDRNLDKRGACGTAYCFAGHAEFIRSRGKRINPLDHSWHHLSAGLQKWLGLGSVDLDELFREQNTIDDFKRWHKAGKIK